MGQCYGQLSLEERVEIYRLHAGGRSQNEIASALDRAPSTISRELRRNSRPTKVWNGGYEPVRAQQLAERRRRWDGRFKLARQTDLRNCVGESLAMGHSPEQIAGRLAQEHGRVIISHESIYRFIYHRAAQKDCWHRLLPRHKDEGAAGAQAAAPPALSNNGARSPNAPPRSKAVGRRAIGKPTSCYSLDVAKGCWFSTNEKPASASFIIRSIEKLSSPPELSLVNSANSQRRYRKTISFDNGNEFAEHHRLHKTIGVQTFFCDPHSPWQKGGVENSIGRLRRSLPRKTDLNLITAAALKRHVQRLNDTPRKCLDFKTPAEAFSKLKSIVALQT
jgi:IS30 family transposase